mgnify:CR=1 FL=1
MEQLNITGQKGISLGAIANQAGRATDMMTQVRSAVLSPTSRKTAPTFNLSQLALMLDIEKGPLSHRMNKGDLPTGQLNAAGTRREFTLAEARTLLEKAKAGSLQQLVTLADSVEAPVAAVIMGSGNAPFFAFAALAPAVAAKMSIAPVLMVLPMHLVASSARAISPITAVIVVSSSMGGVSPFDVVKRTAIPMVGSLLVVIIANFALFYR